MYIFLCVEALKIARC